MYEEHNVFERPSSGDVKIWRYLDFTKYVALLDKRALYFSRADKLGDPFEGSYPVFNTKVRPLLNKGIPDLALSQMADVRKKAVETMFVNCWHLNTFESAAMWKLYLASGEGVAIQSTFDRLIKGFDKTTRKIYVGQVKYIDYENEWCPEDNMFYPFLHKRKSFEHEKELRAIFPEFSGFNTEIPSGFIVETDLEILIENIHTSPTAPEWFYDMVKSVSEKYGISEQKVRQSHLNEKPIY